MASSVTPPISPLGLVPIPDPTILTTDQLRREIAATREVIDARISAVDKIIASLQLAADKQPSPLVLEERTVISKQTADQRYAEVKMLMQELRAEQQSFRIERAEQIKTAVGQMAEVLSANLDNQIMLSQQRFERTQTQFSERDERAKMQSSFDNSAVETALATVRESTNVAYASNVSALNKLENSFTKQIDTLITAMNTIKINVDEKINDIKSRLDRGEGGIHSVERAQDHGATTTGNLFTGILALVGVMTLVGGIIAFVLSKH